MTFSIKLKFICKKTDFYFNIYYERGVPLKHKSPLIGHNFQNGGKCRIFSTKMTRFYIPRLGHCFSLICSSYWNS